MMLRDPLLIGDLPRHAARAFGEAPAIITESATATFAEVEGLTEAVAAGLLALDLPAGARVGLFGENGVEWVAAYYGICRAGALVVPVHPRRTAADLAAVLADCDIQLLIASAPKLRAAGFAAPAELRTIAWGEGPRPSHQWDFADLLRPRRGAAFPRRVIDPSSEAVICYTSGTTRAPAAVRLRHRSLILSAAMLAQMHGRSAADVVASPMSCANVYGAGILNAAVLVGSPLLFLDGLDAEAMATALERHRATMMDGVPTIYAGLLEALGDRPRDLSALRLGAMGGAPMPFAKHRRLEAALGCPVVELWGMTELSGVSTTHPLRGLRTRGSIGVPIPYLETRISPLADAADAVGEMQVRGPLLMAGYLDAEATARAFDSEGWFSTGDLMRRTDDGEFIFVDRREDVIETAAGPVFPAEIERVIGEIPGVALAAVAVCDDPDAKWTPKVFVVRDLGAAVTTQEIISEAILHLPPQARPTAVVFRHRLPLTGTGKVIRRHLNDEPT